MEKSTAEVLKWLADTIDIYDIRFGLYEAWFDQADQYQEWHCQGCAGVGSAKWPEWKVTFKHKPGCMYERFCRLLEDAKAEAREAAVHG